MRVDTITSLPDAALRDHDLAIPGIDGHGLASILVWLGGPDDGAAVVSLLRTAVEFAMRAPGSVGWACAWVPFAAHMDAFAQAGWLDPAGPQPYCNWTDRGAIVWRAIPNPGSFEWQPFWQAPLNPVFANIIVVDGTAISDSPPRTAIGCAQAGMSTLLRWPWAPDIDVQTRWLASVESSIRLLTLGVLDCDSGVQLVLPLADTRGVMEAIERCLP